MIKLSIKDLVYIVLIVAILLFVIIKDIQYRADLEVLQLRNQVITNARDVQIIANLINQARPAQLPIEKPKEKIEK